MPWIEVEGSYQTRREAKKAADDFLNSIQMKIVTIPEKGKQMKAMVTIRE